MSTIKLNILDNYDLTLLYCAINHLCTMGRIDLVKNNTNQKRIESVWIKETADEFERLTLIKNQLMTAIKTGNNGECK